MRICLMSRCYPPAFTEGIARQRQLLAESLLQLDHEVHVLTLADEHNRRRENGVFVHELCCK